jgi:hypothetical protein
VAALVDAEALVEIEADAWMMDQHDET